MSYGILSNKKRKNC